MPLMPTQNYYNYRALGIDPGLNNTGVSVLEIDACNNRIVGIEAFTLMNDRLLDRTGLEEGTHSERLIKLYKLKQALRTALGYIDPVWIACEAPFYNRFRPTAYAPLVEVVGMLNAASLEYNPNIGFTLYSPLTVKKTVGAKSIKNDTEKGKIEVKQAITMIPEIMSVLKSPLTMMTDHAIDSIAVGYTWFKNKDVVV